MWKNASKLFFISAFLIFFSCSVRHTVPPDIDGLSLQESLSARSAITSIGATFSIVLEKDDSEIRGDGVLSVLKNGDLSLRIYSLGFLAFEMTAENGNLKSNPPVDRNRGLLLSYGVRDCLFWWDLKPYTAEEDEGFYILHNSARTIRIDKKTMLPVMQTVSLDDGKTITIRYDNPAFIDAVWHPSKIRIELARYAVTLNVKNISFLSGDQAEINRDRPDDSPVYNIFPGEISFQKGIVANGVD